MKLSKKALSINPSSTLAIDAKAKRMKAQGLNIIGFGAGEPDFDTPDHIKNAAKKAIDEGFTKYTPASGTLELKEAICKKLERENGLNYKPSNIVVSNGAKHSLLNTFQTICNPEDEVIIITPAWVSYPEMVRLADAIPVYVETKEEDGFKCTLDRLKRLLQKTKAILINSPGNPTGMIYTKDELRAIADLAVDNNIYIVSDEIYEKLIYNGYNHVSIASFNDKIKELTILVNGISKSYAMTGWRIGYTASNEKIAKVMANIQSHATSNPNSIAQKLQLRPLRATGYSR